ncbi:obg-like protein ATPase 1 isoform X1 [Cinnamomum micranthum f. kanehirae]|uniref:Obg-like ATPase homolog n=1 Tax=Cinnamomum micranthum f. kanehirae TaxID=337451 RepID=A0A3S3NEE9_9MAGN|nr:obg-like protein ATPase 1 isoform X1 [Cinnamomum micranthum f. kanehirae]
MDAPAERAKYRRFFSHFTFGLVGFSSFGTLFLDEAFQKQAIPEEHFPFCDLACIQKKTGTRLDIHDERYEWLCKYYKPKREVSAFLKIMNPQYLDRGLHQGYMLDEKQLRRLQAVDAIFIVLSPEPTEGINIPSDKYDMDFGDPNVSDSADFVEDLKSIRNELRFKDLEFMRRKVEDLEGSIQISSDKQLKIIHECCKKVKAWLEEGKDVRFGHWEDTDGQILSTFHLLTDKPVVYLVNVSKDDYQKEANEFLPNIHAWVQEHGGEPIILFNAVLEYQLATMSKFEAAEYCEENKLVSAIPKIIKAGFSVLNSIYFYTAYPDEVQSWLIRQTTAPQAAGAIHPDFEEGFVHAEVIKYEDLIELGTVAAVKDAGKCRVEGKTYVVQDGDIIFFKLNVSVEGRSEAIVPLE